jgi:hypothetical protein
MNWRIRGSIWSQAQWTLKRCLVSFFSWAPHILHIPLERMYIILRTCPVCCDLFVVEFVVWLQTESSDETGRRKMGEKNLH